MIALLFCIGVNIVTPDDCNGRENNAINNFFIGKWFWHVFGIEITVFKIFIWATISANIIYIIFILIIIFSLLVSDSSGSSVSQPSWLKDCKKGLDGQLLLQRYLTRQQFNTINITRFYSQNFEEWSVLITYWCFLFFSGNCSSLINH